MINVLGALGLLVACAEEQRPLFIATTPLATQAAAATVANTPTPLATETAVATARFTYQGISFSYANGLLRRLTAEQQPAAANLTRLAPSDLPIFYFGVPDFLLFNFDTNGSSPTPSRLVIQQLRDDTSAFYDGYPETAIGRFDQLAARLDTQAAKSVQSPLSRPLTFANGSGFRSVGLIAHLTDPVPLSDAHLFYLYEGLTEDGRTYIWLQFNLQTPILPDEPGQFSPRELATFRKDATAYQAYLDEQMALIQALPPTAFTPNLAHLDDLIQSLTLPPQTAVTTSLPINQLDCTNRAAYIADITVPNGTQMSAGQTFIKTWRIQNIGNCTWSAAYQLIRDTEILSIQEKPLLPVVLPGATVDISIPFTSPTEPGIYQETWRLQTPHILDQKPPYDLFGPMLTIHVEVIANES